MFFIKYNNFKCEDCEGDKFTIHEPKESGTMTLYCATKDCGACYDFNPVMKQTSSTHPTKICKCGQGFLSRDTKFCSGCGKKNPGYRSIRTSDSPLKNNEKEVMNNDKNEK